MNLLSQPTIPQANRAEQPSSISQDCLNQHPLLSCRSFNHIITRLPVRHTGLRADGHVRSRCGLRNPHFGLAFDRRHPETFIDYFAQISEFEPTRAAEFGIRHFVAER